MSTALRRTLLLAVLAVIVAVTIVGAVVVHSHDDSRTHYLGAAGWPNHGQASYVLDGQCTAIEPGTASGTYCQLGQGDDCLPRAPRAIRCRTRRQGSR